MPASTKTSTATKDRRKSDKMDKTDEADKSPANTSSSSSSLSSSSSPGLITLTVSPDRLRAIVDPASVVIKEDSPVKESPATSTTLPAAPPSNADLGNASDSAPGTPAAGGTPAPQPAMGPPADGPKKKGVKRSAAAMNGNGNGNTNGDGVAKPRGKPGPKKKQRLEDGTLEPNRPGALASHKLGPKANQGAINAGLRALDRSGAPCRRWQKGGFKLKSFTGVVWEIPRWTGETRDASPLPQDESGTVSAEAGSTKENKENDPVKSDNSNSGGDVEMRSVASVNPSSPAPIAIAAES